MTNRKPFRGEHQLQKDNTTYKAMQHHNITLHYNITKQHLFKIGNKGKAT